MGCVLKVHLKGDEVIQRKAVHVRQCLAEQGLTTQKSKYTRNFERAGFAAGKTAKQATTWEQKIPPEQT